MDSITELIKKKTGEEKLAEFISYLFHPLLMSTYGFLILFFTPNYVSVFTPLALKLAILGITLVFTCILPLVNTVILLKTGRIKSLKMEDPSDRNLPYAGTILYYFGLFYLFHTATIPSIFKVLVLGAAVAIALTFIINFKWKISAHTTGIGGIIGALLATIYRLNTEFYLMLMVVVLIAGIIGYARLKLNAHTPAQVYTGFLLGFLTEFFIVLLF
jgi:membrane-associated phospholipid phosphatase